MSDMECISLQNKNILNDLLLKYKLYAHLKLKNQQNHAKEDMFVHRRRVCINE